MNGQQWPWYHKPLIIKNERENFRMDEKWRMNENVERWKSIYRHTMFLHLNTIKGNVNKNAITTPQTV